MAQRLARAKAKIRDRADPVPGPARRSAARSGWTPCSTSSTWSSTRATRRARGDAHIRRSLCAEALRLAAIVAELMPDEAEALGLHALLLAHDARRDARVDAAGALVLLEDQDRVALGQRRDRAGHPARRPRAAPRPARPLRPAGRDRRRARQRAERRRHPLGPHRRVLPHLAALGPDPVVELNRAVAIALAGDLDGGLARIDALAGDPRPLPLLPRRPRRPPAPARRGERPRAAYERALELAGNAAERAFLERRLEETR